MAITFTPTAGTLTTGVQSAYAIEHGAAYEGMQADSGTQDVISLVNTSGAQLYFGHLVVAGSNGGAKVVSGASDVPLGIAISTKTFEDGPIKENDDRVGYPDKTVANILRRGRVWVYVQEAVAVGDQVRVYHTADTGKKVGRFAKTAAGGKTAKLNNCQFLTATSGAGLAVIEINGADLALTADAAQ